MIVVDASALIELLLGTQNAGRIGDRIFGGASLHAPHLLDIEVTHVLRRYVASSQLSAARGRQAVDDLMSLRLRRWSHLSLVPRVWALRDNLSAYDAAYVTLAEALDAPLLTCDRKLANASGHRAQVELA